MPLPPMKCPTCGSEFVPQRRTAKYCSDKCRYHNFLANKKRITVPSDMRFSILRRDGFRCRYCGDGPDKKHLVIDHIKSLKDGGARMDPKNLITACRICNAGKGETSLTLDEVPPLSG